MPDTLATIETNARIYALDTDANNYGITQAQFWVLINRWYVYLRNQSPRYVWETATTLGTTLAQGDVTVAPSVATIQEWKAIFRETAAGNTKGRPLDLEPWIRVQQLQDTDATQGTPLVVGLQRIGTFTAANVGKYKLNFWPIPDAAYYLSAQVRYEVTEMAAGADKPDVLDEQAKLITLAAAAEACVIMRRFDLADRWVGLLPTELADAVRIHSSHLREKSVA